VRLLFDTNVILDVIERRQGHYSASLQMVKQARHGAIEDYNHIIAESQSLEFDLNPNPYARCIAKDLSIWKIQRGHPLMQH
jgi:hypothetical protein